MLNLDDTTTLTAGDQITRVELHRALGGQTQSGISPSSRAPVIFLFSDPLSGEKHGYYDGWDEGDGLFHYTGEGQRGEQRLNRGNAAIRDHAAGGRTLHLFFGEGKGKPVTYGGQFECVDHYPDQAPETDGGPQRLVFVFRLKPLDGQTTDPARVRRYSRAVTTTVDTVAIEQHLTERMVVDPSREPIEAERREAALVREYAAHLRRAGHTVSRLRIVPAGEAKPLYTDLYDSTDGELVEAKGAVTREAVRMAIGQLADYSRFITPAPRLTVLLPSEPRRDLRDLLAAARLDVVFPANEGWCRLLP